MPSFSKALEYAANFFVSALFKVHVPLHMTALDISSFCPGSFCSCNFPAVLGFFPWGICRVFKYYFLV